MKRLFSILIILFLFSWTKNYSYSQTIFLESMGNPVGTISIASHESANGFDNDSYTFSGTGDIRTSTASGGYSGATGNGNAFLTNNGTSTFQISGISTSSCTSISISFGAYKSTIASDMSELIMEYSTDGSTFNSVSLPIQPTGTGTAVWRLITTTLPAGCNNQPNLILRWRNSSSGAGNPQFRIDDISLFGTCSTPFLLSNLSSNAFSISCTDTQNGTIDYNYSNTFNNGNFLIAQLSDANGSFTAPVNIGSLATLSNSGTLSFTIPQGMQSGTGYRIRVLSSLPEEISSDNGVDITIINTDGSCLGPADVCAQIIQFQVDPETGNNGTEYNTGEFIQICNTCNTMLDISCFNLCFTDDFNGVRRGECIRIPTGTILGPGECYLMGGNGTNSVCCTGSATAVDWPSATLDLNWHTCGCVVDTEGINDGFVGVLSDSGEDITLFDANGGLLSAVTFENSAGANYSQSLTISGTVGCSSTNIIIPPSSSHVNAGSAPAGSTDDEGYLFDCTTNSWVFANHDNSDGIINLNPDMVYDCVLITPLAVEINEYFGYAKDGYNVLFWSTSSEQNNDYFTVLHSTDGQLFESLGTIPGAGNSSTEINYSFIHDRPQTGINYYKLRSTDYDGTTYEKGLISIMVDASSTYFDPITSSLVFEELGSYEIITPDGRTIGRIVHSNRFELLNKGVILVRNLSTGSTERLFIP